MHRGKRPHKLQDVVVKAYKRHIHMLDFKSLNVLKFIEEGWPRVHASSQDEDTVSTVTNKELKGDEELVKPVREFSI